MILLPEEQFTTLLLKKLSLRLYLLSSKRLLLKL